MPWNIDNTSPTLKIGDYVTLKHSTPVEGWLSAEGIITEDVILSNDESAFENCLWEVHVQNQYTAVREYEEVLFSKLTEETPNHGDAVYEDQFKRSDDLVDQLHRAATNEGRLNEKLMTMKIGKPVSFGDVIQLRHVKSKKFLTVNAAVLAKNERENIRVSLEGYGDSMSWLEFMPRSKADKEGNVITCNSEAFVRVHDRPSEFIHCARKVSKSHKTTEREINCSLENSCWTISIFQGAHDAISNCILAGQLVTLLEPESSSFICVDEKDVSRVILQQSSIMDFTSSGRNVGTNLLWMIEKSPNYRGGNIGSRGEKVSLRHLNTGLFARVDSKSTIRTVDKREHCSYFEISSVSSPAQEAGSIMDHSLVQLACGGQFLRTSVIQARHTAFRSGSSDPKDSSPSISRKALAGDSATAQNQVLSTGRASSVETEAVRDGGKCFFVRDIAMASYLTITNELQQSLGVDVFVGVEARKILHTFESAVRDGSMMSEPVGTVESTVKLLFTVMDILFQFLTDDLLDAAHMASLQKEDWRHDVTENPSNVKATSTRQALMREQGVLSAVIGIIELCSEGKLLQLPNFIRRVRDAGQMKTPSLRALSRKFNSLQSMVSTINEEAASSPTLIGKKVLLSSAITAPARAPPNRVQSMGAKQARLSRTRTASFNEDVAGLVQTAPSPLRPGRKKLTIDTNQGNIPRPIPFEDNSDDEDDENGDDHSRDSGLFRSYSAANEDSRRDRHMGLALASPGNVPDEGLASSGTSEEGVDSSLSSLSREISTSCFRMLLAIIHDNHTNQMFIADKFAVLLSQVKDQELAVVCVQEMLRDNLQMLQTKVREKEIGIFLQLLEESDMNVTLLNLLRSTCSCPMGVDSTQRLVANALFQPMCSINRTLAGGGLATIDSQQSDVDFADDHVDGSSYAGAVSEPFCGEEVDSGVHESPVQPQLSLPSSLGEPPSQDEEKFSDPKVRVGSMMKTPMAGARSSFTFAGAKLKRSLLVTVSMNTLKRMENIPWPESSVYLPPTSSDYSHVLGYSLVQKGLPYLTLNWATGGDGSDLSMLRVFGVSRDVPFESLQNLNRFAGIALGEQQDSIISFAGGAKTADVRKRSRMSFSGNKRLPTAAMALKQRTSRHSTIAKNRLKVKTNKRNSARMIIGKKMQVLDYFCGQIYLLADLCMDRNYVAMTLVGRQFPYEMLITMLKHPLSQNRLKAPVCRLLRCLYVDRDPQVEEKFPRLIRRSIEIDGPEDGKTSNVSYYSFALLQQIIVDYIKNDMDMTHCDELSAEMINLLLALIRFGFYSNVSQLEDIISTLSKALDDHQYSYTEKKLSSGSSGSLSSASLGSFDMTDAKKEESGKSSVNRESPMAGRVSLWQAWIDRVRPSPSDHNRVIPDSNSASGNSRRQNDSIVMRFLGFVKGPGGGFNSVSPDPADQNVTFRDDKGPNQKTNTTPPVSRLSSYPGLGPGGTIGNTLSAPVTSTWKGLVLSFMDSFYFNIFIVVVVLVSTCIAVTSLLYPSENALLTVIDLFITGIFFSELSLRVYCTYQVHREVLSFLTNPYKLLDVVVVGLDIAMLATGVLSNNPSIGGAAKFTKTLRILRILRLIRLVRAARLIRRITKKNGRLNSYKMPARFMATTEFEMRTLIAMIRILSIAHDRLQDRKLGMFIQEFSGWFDDTIRNKGRDAKELYSDVCSKNDTSACFPEKFGEGLMDVIMYSNPVLSQEALRLLMVHECSEWRFISTAQKVQIIHSVKLENMYKSLTVDLKQMRVLAESFELWCHLSSDKEIAAADNLLSTIKNISRHATRQHDSRKFDHDMGCRADSEVQQLLFNMDGMNTFMYVQYALLNEGNKQTPDKRIDDIITACNELIILFVDSNEVNQAIAFAHLDWFLARVDDHLLSSAVARAIVTGNRSLIKQCSRTHVADLIRKIVTQGRKPMYLDFLIGLTDVMDNGDSGILSLRSEISRHITSRERAQYITEWCDSPTEAGYEERRQEMAPYVAKQQAFRDSELSLPLQYHINFLALLVGCKLGQKLQAVYSIEDYVATIIDASTLSNVRRGLGLLLLEMVESNVDGLLGSESMWLFIDFTIDYYHDLSAKIQASITSKEHNYMRQELTEWMHVTLMIIIQFFDSFDYVTFREVTLFETDSCFTTTHRTDVDIQNLIDTLFRALNVVRCRQSAILGPILLQYFDLALASLGQLCSQAVESELVSRSTFHNSFQSKGGRRVSVKQFGNATADALHEAFYRKQFVVFLQNITEKKSYYLQASVSMMERLPSVMDQVKSDVRLETFLSKITSHVCSRIVKTSATMTLDKATVDTTLWLVETWTLIIFREIGVELDKLVDPLTLIVPKTSHYQSVMNEYGVTVLCLNLVSVGIDPELSIAALKLLVALLAKGGGHKEVQDTIHAYLKNTDSTLFFELIKDLIEQMMMWCQREADLSRDSAAAVFDGVIVSRDNSISLPESVVVLKFIHAMCDGGHADNKNIIREQVGNARWVNLLDYIGSYADLLSRLQNRSCAGMGIRVMHAAIGLMQGPCRSNQEHFVLHTNLLSALNRIMRSSQLPVLHLEDWAHSLEVLKEFVIDTLLASIEGHSHGSVVLERVQIAMEINVLNVLIIPSEIDDDGDMVELTDLSRLQAKYLVFLKALNFAEADIPLNAKLRLEQDVASIEVVWNHRLYRHHFNLPIIAKDITESSKRRLVEEVDLSSQELKLKDFMRIAKDLHREALHHQMLKGYGISNIWNYKGTISWVMLVNAFTINVLLAMYYKTTEGSEWELDLPSHVDKALFTLLILQNVGAFCAFVMSIIARIPVLYASFRDSGQSEIVSMCRALVDPLTFWQYCYMILSVLAVVKSPLFASALLLDFVVLDSTSRDVLNAVIYPARQLATALFIILIMVNVFAGIIFSFYHNEFELGSLQATSLWESIKLSITYGVRANEGIGAYMEPSTSGRFALDMFFYITITVVLLNIFFGIIIDTFGKLRNLKVERDLDRANKCYICGVDVHDFVKRGSASLGDSSFKHHRVQIHNLWNYLYFAMHIWQQHRDQDSSVEMHVRGCMENGDISWFPIGISDGSSILGDGVDDSLRRERALLAGNEVPAESSNRSMLEGVGASGPTDGNMRENFERLSQVLTERLGNMQDSLYDSSSHKRESNSGTSLGPLRVGVPPSSADSPTVTFRKKLAGVSPNTAAPALSPTDMGGPPAFPGQSPYFPQQSGEHILPTHVNLSNAELVSIIASCIKREVEPLRRKVAELSAAGGLGGGKESLNDPVNMTIKDPNEWEDSFDEAGAMKLR